MDDLVAEGREDLFDWARMLFILDGLARRDVTNKPMSLMLDWWTELRVTKDWLQEQDEASLQRLRRLAEIQRMCREGQSLHRQFIDLVEKDVTERLREERRWRRFVREKGYGWLEAQIARFEKATGEKWEVPNG